MAGTARWRPVARNGSCEVEEIPGGPVLVRGADAVVGPDGVECRAERPVVAICACGFSQRAPWCDGTHKVART